MDMTDKLTEFPEFPELKFDDEHHIYRLDGVVIPSVSSVMEPLSGAKYAGISGKTLEKAANKGTSVHNSIENFLKFGIEDVNPTHRGYFNAFREWWEKNQPELVGSECRIYHKILQYGGTIDLLAYIRGVLTLVDFKSTYALSDMTCGVQLEACAFQRYLVRFILDYDIPCSFPLLDFVDDVSDYLYACLLNKKCCICGKAADLHHEERVGMGRDRETMVHEGMEVLPLCRGHHTIAHSIGEKAFKEKYHIPHGIILDKNLCKVYGLKTKKESTQDVEQDYPHGQIDP